MLGSNGGSSSILLTMAPLSQDFVARLLRTHGELSHDWAEVEGLLRRLGWRGRAAVAAERSTGAMDRATGIVIIGGDWSVWGRVTSLGRFSPLPGGEPLSKEPSAV